MPTLLASLLWLLLLGAVLAQPALTSSAPDDELIRNTIRLSLLYYAAALNLMLWLRPADWPAATPRGRLARCCWTLAWAAYLVHLATAFQVAYQWSHADAVEHTRQVSGVGEGIYVSHFFTLVWTADVLYWWRWPEAYARRSPWAGRALHGFMLFVVFNGTVVYEAGPIRWAAVVMFAELAAMVWARRRLRLQPVAQGV
jgi:hypothetical protein